MPYRYYRMGINLESIQEMNRSLVLRLIRRFNICSRADLAKATGLKQPTITNIINDLIKLDLVKETGIIDGKKGRRSIGITLGSDKFKIIGVRLTRNYYLVGLFDLSGEMNFLNKYPINILEGSKVAIKNIEKSIISLLENYKEDKIIGIGLAIPGPYIQTEGRIALITEFPGWEDVYLEKELNSTFNIPVYIEHDANAGAIAEWWARHRKKQLNTMVYIAAGQGIGAGIIIDGQLYRGSQGIAGEIGFMSIKYDGYKNDYKIPGILTHYCSTISLIKLAEKDLNNNPDSMLNKKIDLNSIVKAVKNNDKYATEVFEKIAWFMSLGIANVINIINPDVVVIGDEFSLFGDYLLDYIKKQLKKFLFPSIYEKLSLELSRFEVDPALIGASELVIDRVLHEPSIIQKII